MITRPAPEGQEFRLVTGDVVSTIEELLEYLREISEEEYDHHVTDGRNDFADWIRNVHGNEPLANKLDDAKNPEEAVEVVRKRVKRYYENKPSKKPKVPKNDTKKTKEKISQKKTENKKGETTKRTEPAIDTSHGEFIVKEFVYGAIFGFILGMLAAGILNSLIG